MAARFPPLCFHSRSDCINVSRWWVSGAGGGGGGRQWKPWHIISQGNVDYWLSDGWYRILLIQIFIIAGSGYTDSLSSLADRGSGLHLDWLPYCMLNLVIVTRLKCCTYHFVFPIYYPFTHQIMFATDSFIAPSIHPPFPPVSYHV